MGRKRDIGTGNKKFLDLLNRAKLGLIHIDHHPGDDEPTLQFTSNYRLRLIPNAVQLGTQTRPS